MLLRGESASPGAYSSDTRFLGSAQDALADGAAKVMTFAIERLDAGYRQRVMHQAASLPQSADISNMGPVFPEHEGVLAIATELAKLSGDVAVSAVKRGTVRVRRFGTMLIRDIEDPSFLDR